MTHFRSLGPTHTKNKFANGQSSPPAISFTPQAAGCFNIICLRSSVRASRQLPQANLVLEGTGEVGHFWRAKYGHFSRVPKTIQSNGARSQASSDSAGCRARILKTSKGVAALQKPAMATDRQRQFVKATAQGKTYRSMVLPNVGGVSDTSEWGQIARLQQVMALLGNS
jgi:hypothetical protein